MGGPNETVDYKKYGKSDSREEQRHCKGKLSGRDMLPVGKGFGEARGVVAAHDSHECKKDDSCGQERASVSR